MVVDNLVGIPELYCVVLFGIQQKIKSTKAR